MFSIYFPAKVACVLFLCMHLMFTPITTATADDDPAVIAHGETVFNQMVCFSCHGKNMEGGVGPSLVDGIWLKGSSDAEILKSINEGSVEKGMPSYAALQESDKKALIAFIKSREQGVRDVTYQVYDGSWQMLPDFTTLKPSASGSLNDGEPISVAKFGKTQNYGAVFTGQLKVPVDGEYTFSLNSDDGSALRIDDTLVCDNDGLHSDVDRVTGAIKLTAGSHKFEIRYMQGLHSQNMRLTWHGPVTSAFITEYKATPNQIDILAKIRVVRGNIPNQTSTNMMMIGFPGGNNVALDLDNNIIPQAWKGAFLDVSGSRLDRGYYANKPLGQKIVSLSDKPLVQLADKPSEKAKFLSYRMADTKLVVFWELGDAKFSETFEASAGNVLVTVNFSDPVSGNIIIQESNTSQRTVPAAESKEIQLTFSL